MARWIGVVASVALAARAVVDGLRLAAELRYHALLSRGPEGLRSAAAELIAIEGELIELGHAADGLLLGAALLFAGWLYLRYRALGERRRPAPWALFGWLVPGLNLVEPYRIVREVHAGGAEGARGRAPWLVFGWWSAWLLYLVLLVAVIAAESRASRHLAAGEARLAFEQGLLGSRLSVAVAAASLLAALLALALVAATERRISARG